MAEVEADSARTMFSCFRGDGRDVLPLVKGRRGELNCLLCASFLCPETGVHPFWL